jgi:CTP synthase
VESLNAESIYEVPLMYERAGLGELVGNRLGLEDRAQNLAEWEGIVEKIKHPAGRCCIAVVGKYTQNGDSYKSIAEALIHAGGANDAKVDIRWIESQTLESTVDPATVLGDVDGVIVAPGFGDRGIEGKIRAMSYVRESGLPFLGICLGLQMAVIEFARNVCGLEGANTTEVASKAPYPVISVMPDQTKVESKGGTMRLGTYPCNLTAGTLAHGL